MTVAQFCLITNGTTKLVLWNVHGLTATKKGRAQIRFGNSALAQEKFQDVQDGILRHISVGYSVNDMTCDNPEADWDDLRYIVTDWQPYEISLVTVPADPTVGVGRSQDKPIFNQYPNLQGNHNMDNPNLPQTQTQNPYLPRQPTPTPPNADRVKAERERAKELIAIGEAYQEFGGERMAADAIRNGWNKEQLQEKIAGKYAHQTN